MILPLDSDVVDHILSFLRADLATLKSCTQAHPLLSELAERHIYHTTTLDIKPGCDFDLTQFSLLLKNNPRIRLHIHSLAINILKPMVSATPVIMAMSSILSPLPCLNKITLTYSGSTIWIGTHQLFRSAFLNILQQPSVTNVHLESIIDFPLSFLITCQNIKTLSLSNCNTYSQVELTPPSHHLESLSVRFSDYFDWATDHIGSLTSLMLRPKIWEIGALPKTFEACAESLTTLELDMRHLGQSVWLPPNLYYANLSDDPIDPFPFTLSGLTNLQHLTIRTVILANQVEEETPDGKIGYDFIFRSAIRAIAQLIEHSAPSVRQVVLKISCCNFPAIGFLAELNWGSLLILGDSPTCPHIDLCISVQILATDCGSSFEQIRNTLARTKLIRLVNTGVLSIKPETNN